MEPDKELNQELKEEVNALFAGLFKEIGTNRAQLANKVLGFHKEINKELTKTKVDAKRKTEILAEIVKIRKMAAQQLPHMNRVAPTPVVGPPVAKPMPVEKKLPAPKAIPPTKAAPSAKSTVPAKPAPPAKPTPPAKATPTTKKKKK